MRKNTLPLYLSIVLLMLSTSIARAELTNPESFESNKEMVLHALTAVFVHGDTDAVEKYWKEDYIQHNPMFPNGRDVILGFAQNRPEGFKYEPGLIMEDGDFVMVHSRYSGFSPNPMIAVDIFRIEDGKIAEHWDVLQEEVSAKDTASGNAMFPIHTN